MTRQQQQVTRKLTPRHLQQSHIHSCPLSPVIMIIGDWAIHANNNGRLIRIPAPAPPPQSGRSSAPAYSHDRVLQRQFSPIRVAVVSAGIACCRPKKEIAANAANKTKHPLPRAAHGSTPRPPADREVEQSAPRSPLARVILIQTASSKDS